MGVSLKYESYKPQRIEIFNFKDTESQRKFKGLTTSTTDFSNCFKTEKKLFDQINEWQDLLNVCISKSFKKIRVKHKKVDRKTSASELIDERNKCSKKGGETDAKDVAIWGKIEEEQRNLIFENFKTFSDNPGGIQRNNMWKLVRKLWPKTGSSLPIAKKNYSGRIVSSPQDIKQLLSQECVERLRSRPLRPGLKCIKNHI